MSAERTTPRGGAVFLSYASQDAEAAKRICEALRAAGVEVWFDTDGGLEHGDEWDAKIRRQIKECVLFLPVISANTQAREEGYFRIEWELAAQRAMGIASGVAFILPVVIDDTREPDALVPDRFRAVQWTKLPCGDLPADVKQRFLKLWSHRTGALKHAFQQESPSVDSTLAPAAEPMRSRRGRLGWIIGAAAAAVLLGALGQRFLQREKPFAPTPATVPQPAPPASVGARVFPRDPELKRAWDLVLITVNATLEDFALAEDIVKSVLAKRPTDPEAAIVYAWVHNAHLNRGFDVSEERHVLGRRYAERAVQLAPEDPEAIAALGQFLSFRRADLARAEQLLRRAIELNPREPRYYRALAYGVMRFLRPDEALPLGERAAELFPNDALVCYELALHYRDAGRIDDMERAFDRSLALAPVGGALIWKSWIAVWVHGDLVGMKRWIEQVPAALRLSDRALTMRYQYACLTRQPAELAEVLRMLQAFPGNSLRDFYYTGPKALLIGDVFAAQGKPELARAQYEAALAELAREKALNPADPNVLNAELWTLLGLGRREAALADVKLFIGAEPAGARPRFIGWWFNVLPAALLLGDRELTLQRLRRYAVTPALRNQLRTAFRVDPRMAPWRDDQEIAALIAEPKTGALTAAADAKSVAVLPFENQSADRENEYFSDGLADELLTTLQKIPGLRVAARTSAWSFKGKGATAREVGEKLGMAHVVEGSVQKSGNRVRITARLSRAATNEEVWSKAYGPLELKDVFATQTELALAIVAELRGRLGDGPAGAQAEIAAQVRAAEVGGTRIVEAHEEYLRGRYFANQFTLESFRRAEESLRRAVALDPKFGLAWASLANVGRLRSGFEDTRADVDAGFELAREASARAVDLFPDLPAAHLARLNYQLLAFEWKEAVQSLRRIAELAPEAVAESEMKVAHALGDRPRAAAAGRRAVALDPVNPELRVNFGWKLLGAGQWAEAEAQFRRAAELSPAAAWGHAGAAISLLLQGRAKEATVEAAREVPAWSRRLALALACWADGNRAESERALAELIAADADVAAYQVAQVYAFRGDLDLAFEWFERARRQRDPGLILIRSDPLLDAARTDPRWGRLLQELGLADEQLK